MDSSFVSLFTFLFLSNNRFLSTIIRLYISDFFQIKYSSLLIRVLIIKLSVISELIIAVS